MFAQVEYFLYDLAERIHIFSFRILPFSCTRLTEVCLLIVIHKASFKTMFAQVEYFLYDLAERIVKNAYNMLFFRIFAALS